MKRDPELPKLTKRWSKEGMERESQGEEFGVSNSQKQKPLKKEKTTTIHKNGFFPIKVERKIHEKERMPPTDKLPPSDVDLPRPLIFFFFLFH